jgi:hypothetical protein
MPQPPSIDSIDNTMNGRRELMNCLHPRSSEPAEPAAARDPGAPDDPPGPRTACAALARDRVVPHNGAGSQRRKEGRRVREGRGADEGARRVQVDLLGRTWDQNHFFRHPKI